MLSDTKEDCVALRNSLSVQADLLDRMRRGDVSHPLGESPDIHEVKANLSLAYRHVEDARMRLGKAIQALDGGVSCCDK